MSKKKQKFKKPVTKKRNKKLSHQPKVEGKKESFALNKAFLWTALFISLAITLLSYYPAFHNGWTNLDDDKYVLNNPKIQSLEGNSLKTLLTKPHDGNFHPLTMLSLAIDYHFDKNKPQAYHFTNIILHLFNTAFIFWFFFLLGKFFFPKEVILFAGIGALLFGVSTIHVESVAWVSERKDVLYAFFYFSSLIAYLYYLEKKQSKFIVYSLLLFLFSVLSKGMAVALSLSIISLDYLYGRKLLSKKVLLEKLPFFLFSLIFGVIAIYAQKSKGYIHEAHTYEFSQRIIYASYGFANYIGKLIYPYGLSAIYPYPRDLGLVDIPRNFYLYLFPTLFVGASFFYFWKKNRHISFSILFFTANLLFVLQLIPVGGVIMSDRYSYVASLGFFYILTYGIIYLITKFKKSKYIILTMLALYISFMSVRSYRQTQIWKSSFSLWHRVLTLYPHTPSAWYNLAVAYYDLKDYKHAIESYDRAIEIQPNYIDAIYNRGNTKYFAGDIKGAVEDYNLCIKMNPNHDKALYNRSIGFIKLRNYVGAEQDCNHVLKLTPNYIDALFNRGIARINLSKNNLAIQDFNQILKLSPQYNKATLYRGVAEARSGNKRIACADISEAMKLGNQEANKYYQKYCK